ncbi:hypothetical protein ACFQ9X_02225 [Catenulispora yoronensis]
MVAVELPAATLMVPTTIAPTRRKGVATRPAPTITDVRIRPLPLPFGRSSDDPITKVCRGRNQENDTIGKLSAVRVILVD